MGTAVTITQTDHAAADLRAFAAKCPDAAQSRRLLAIAMVLDGSSRLEAARQTGMDGRLCATGYIATTKQALPACCRGWHLARHRS